MALQHPVSGEACDEGLGAEGLLRVSAGPPTTSETGELATRQVDRGKTPGGSGRGTPRRECL